MTEVWRDLQEDGFLELPLKAAHWDELETLPRFEAHKDPFDRMLIAQAQSEGMTLVSQDRHFALYPQLSLWLETS